MKTIYHWALLVLALTTFISKAGCCANNSFNRLMTAFSEKRTYYQISEDVNLSGKTIELPKGSVVDFRGGTISNGTIICHDNTLTGYCGIANDVIINGNVIGPLDIAVFQLKNSNRQFDVGKVLNKANKICKSIVVPEGCFYIQTPVVLNDIKFYQQFGSLIYNGRKDDITVLQFYNSFASIIEINGKIAYDTDAGIINYTKNKRTNIIGVEFANVNNSRVYIGDVEYFNNNIRISAYGAGNCYNQYTINLSVFSNEHLRIYQEDKPFRQIGWCNENIIIGGRFCNWSHFDWINCESVAIRIEGAQVGDTYNGVNSLLFIKPCMEGFKNNAIYAKNVTGCHWQDARTEDCGHFIKFVGNCTYNMAETSYGTSLIDYEECLTYPLKIDNLIPVYSITDVKNKVLEINTAESKLFCVKFNGADAKARVGVQYILNDKGKPINQPLQKTMMRPRSVSHPDNFYYNEGASQWKLAADSQECEFMVPDNVSSIRLVLSGRYSGATVYSDKVVTIIER